MQDFSLIQKLAMLMNIILSSPLFLFCAMVGISVLIFYIINIKNNKNINKWVFFSIWIVLLLILIIKYNKVMLSLVDNLFDTIFSALYFPNLSIYIIILSISNILFFYSIFSKKLTSLNRTLNFSSTLLIDILLVLIIDIVNSNNINIYEELNVFSNSNLLVLLQLTSSIFTSWILLSLLAAAHKKLKKYDKSEKVVKLPEIVFEDV